MTNHQSWNIDNIGKCSKLADLLNSYEKPQIDYKRGE